MRSEESLAKRTLSRLGLYEKIASDSDFGEWRSRQRAVTVDGRKLYTSGGDRLIDESELMLNWAVTKGRADAAEVEAAQREIVEKDPPDDVEFIDI
ncbi:MAG TPA: hypothetical protein VF605_15580 [Allosphingosinicella sp.]